MFYSYRQNNSGGSFIIDKDVTLFVIIEADSNGEADNKAEEVGLYFDGCDDGRDCSCCGDRWYKPYGKGDKSPLIHSKPPQEYADNKDTFHWEGDNNPLAYI